VPLKGFSIGGERLRVPMPGSIDSLIERQRARYARMRTREFVSLQPRYQEVAYTFDGTVESRPYFLYQVRTLDGEPWTDESCFPGVSIMLSPLPRWSGMRSTSFIKSVTLT
jgi:hypothetical protein